MKREDCAALDVADPLAAVAFSFHRPAGGLYFDGNSPGAMTAAPMRQPERGGPSHAGDGRGGVGNPA